VRRLRHERLHCERAPASMPSFMNLITEPANVVPFCANGNARRLSSVIKPKSAAMLMTTSVRLAQSTRASGCLLTKRCGRVRAMASTFGVGTARLHAALKPLQPVERCDHALRLAAPGQSAADAQNSVRRSTEPDSRSWRRVPLSQQKLLRGSRQHAGRPR
jgi:hypothetical protein